MSFGTYGTVIKSRQHHQRNRNAASAATGGKRQTIVGEAANTAYLSDQSHDRMATGMSRNNAHVVLSKGSAINLT